MELPQSLVPEHNQTHKAHHTVPILERTDPIKESIHYQHAINPSPKEESVGASHTLNHNLTQKKLPNAPSFHRTGLLSDPIKESICYQLSINPSLEEECSGTSQTLNHSLTQKQIPTAPSFHRTDPLSDPIKEVICYHLAINPSPKEYRSGTSHASY